MEWARKISIYGIAMQLRQMIINNVFLEEFKNLFAWTFDFKEGKIKDYYGLLIEVFMRFVFFKGLKITIVW